MLFLKKEYAKIIRELKDQTRLNWVQIAKELKVTKGMVSFHLHGKCKIPLEKLEILCELAGQPADFPENYFVEETLNVEKTVRRPELDESLSEFLGILAGDGCLTSEGFATIITCSRIFDNEYIQTFVSPLAERLFGIRPNIYTQHNVIRCRVYSKQLWTFLQTEYNIPAGEKYGALQIPVQIRQNPVFLKAFLRGLLDTDGGFFRHHERSAMLQYCSKSDRFRQQVFDALKEMGFRPSLNGNNIFICDRACIERFFQEIGSNNPRNLNRWRAYQETGVVPLQRDLARQMVAAHS
ncbi:MAG: LAGLIDADG family homing endonuclease [Candidatus Diapherotrites archaeon]